MLPSILNSNGAVNPTTVRSAVVAGFLDVNAASDPTVFAGYHAGISRGNIRLPIVAERQEYFRYHGTFRWHRCHWRVGPAKASYSFAEGFTSIGFAF
jgi:hypothetical protein